MNTGHFKYLYTSFEKEITLKNIWNASLRQIRRWLWHDLNINPLLFKFQLSLLLFQESNGAINVDTNDSNHWQNNCIWNSVLLDD